MKIALHIRVSTEDQAKEGPSYPAASQSEVKRRGKHGDRYILNPLSRGKDDFRRHHTYLTKSSKRPINPS